MNLAVFPPCMKLFTYEYKLSSIKNERNAKKMGAKPYKKTQTTTNYI